MLRYGSRGSSVTELQQALKSAGFNPGPIDGIFGPRTQAALRAYQESIGVPVTGVYDDATKAKLDAPEGGDTSGGTDPNTETGEGGGAELPPGGRLIEVTNAEGADGSAFYVVWDWNGVSMAFWAGDAARMKELFGDDFRSGFDQSSKMTQASFDSQQFVQAPSMTIDSQLGTTETIQSQMERQVRAARGEDLPAWIMNDPQALYAMAQGMADGWSPERTWTELAKTDGFQTRFPAWSRYKTDQQTIVGAKDAYLRDEDELRRTLRTFVPPDRLTVDYLGQVMTNGWTAATAVQVMEGAQALRTQPEGLATANAILRARGVRDQNGKLITLDEKGWLNVMAGNASPEVVETLNEAAAASALIQAGLEDTDINLIMSLVDDVTSIRSVEDFASLASNLSTTLIQNARDIDFSRYGLEEDDLVAAAFGRESPTGKSSGQVLTTLAKVERERRDRASFQGTQTQAFVNEQGRLQQAGTGGL